MVAIAVAKGTSRLECLYVHPAVGVSFELFLCCSAACWLPAGLASIQSVLLFQPKV